MRRNRLNQFEIAANFYRPSHRLTAHEIGKQSTDILVTDLPEKRFLNFAESRSADDDAH